MPGLGPDRIYPHRHDLPDPLVGVEVRGKIDTHSKMGSSWSPFLNGIVVYFRLGVTVYLGHEQVYTLFSPIFVS
jgi:hypothetical protein